MLYLGLPPESGFSVDMAERSNPLLSNKVISFIALVLMAGILLDGKLYNRTPKVTRIFPITNPVRILVKQQDQVIMAFEKNNKQWEMTEPTDAPLNAERIQVLLDSNNQLSRSYSASDLPLTDLFPDPISLEINDRQFQLGELEPVSKQRYVRAGTLVYLQADHVLPMIRAGVSAFLDLTVTNTVSKVEIDLESQPNPESWSSLTALGIVSRSKLSTDPVSSIIIRQKNKNDKVYQLHNQDGMVVLTSPLKQYGYLISEQQAIKLGLAKYL